MSRFDEKNALKLRGAMVCLHQLHDFMPYLGWNARSLRSHLLPLLADSGLNALLLEYETMYPWQAPHERLACQDAYSAQEVAELNQEALQCGIRIIPLVQTLGHVYHILYHEEYRNCSELPDQLQQLCPQKDETVKLVCEMLDDVMEHHPDSLWIHLGGDECRLLGQCSVCRTAAENMDGGIYGVYADYYQKITEHVISRGRIPILWHDIVIKYPELLESFDSRVLFHFWNYGDHCHGNLESEFERLRSRISPDRIIGGPAARCEDSHGSLLCSMRLCMDNIERMNQLLRKEQCVGSILTDWPDSGMSFLLSAPLIRYHGALCQGHVERKEFSHNFGINFFGVSIPDFFDRLDAIYGEIPFARGFQTELESHLDRYRFRAFDPECHLNEELDAMACRHSHAEFYKWCHRRLLCRDIISEWSRILPSIRYHRTEFRAFLLIARTMELFLTLSIGISAARWNERHHLEVGYQLTPALIRNDLDDFLNKMPQIRRSWYTLYRSLSIPRHLKNFLKKLLAPQLRVEARRSASIGDLRPPR